MTQTLWRAMVDEKYQELRRQVDWTAIPQIHDYQAVLMNGRPQAARGGWVFHTLDKYLAPMVKSGLGEYADGVSFVSFGCGPAVIEKTLIEYGWPIKKIVCREYDAVLLKAAEQTFASVPIEKKFEFFDFNNPIDGDGSQFDIVFFSGSLHHCEKLEIFLPYLNSLLRPHSLVIGVDYFGPPRLQIDYETLPILKELFNYLPERLQINVVTGQIEKALNIPTIGAMHVYDPTEAPRSSDLRALLFSTFEVIERLPLGGTLLRHLLANKAGNYQTSDDFTILNLLMFIERELIASRRIQSDDMYFVLQQSGRL